LSDTYAVWLLWPFVINLGVAFGAGLYEHRIVLPRWMGGAAGGPVRWNAEAARSDDPGLRFWACVSTLPLTLLTVANLAAAWGAEGSGQGWWLASAAVAAAERLVTFGYFIPAMVRLMARGDDDRARAAAARWRRANHARHGLVLIAWVLALLAFARVNAGEAPDQAHRRAAISARFCLNAATHSATVAGAERASLGSRRRRCTRATSNRSCS
jgi:hypothetical protein